MRPLVSVITLTYNQAEFLPQCLAGVRAQTGDFEIEHILVDDDSADSTPTILEAYRQENPETTAVIRHEANRGANFGMSEAYGVCKGEFVATCEGDDWWISPGKLSAQVALMRKRPDLAMCYHDAAVVYESRLQWPQIKPGFGAAIQTLQDLLEDNRSHTPTVLYRRIPGLEYPDWYTQFTVGDWPNHAFHAASGTIGYIQRPMAAYRVHDKGSWSSATLAKRTQELVTMLEKLDAHFLFRYSERIGETIRRILAEAEAQAA